jgi:hypothetical protein
VPASRVKAGVPRSGRVPAKSFVLVGVWMWGGHGALVDHVSV